MDYTKYLKELKPFPKNKRRLFEKGLKDGYDFYYLLNKLNIKLSDYYVFNEEEWKYSKRRKAESSIIKIPVPVLITPHKKYHRFNFDEKIRIIDLVEKSDITKDKTLKALNVSKTLYYKWLRAYNSGNIDDLRKKYRKSETHNRDKVEFRDEIFKILHSPPKEYGYNRVNWKQTDIYDVMKRNGMFISLHNIRYIIRKEGYRYQKAKKVLTSNDPDFRIKLDKIQKILSKLSSQEKFFSIDEYGPFSIKMKGGKRLVPKGTYPTYPQFQKSKGWLIMTAALELSTNQITHFYSLKKDTEEMIKLLDILIEKYPNEKTLYLSWDAASWHISKKLNERIELINQNSNQPKIKIAPLPSRAQFLNVIESVFSGMSKAIIHNSNYLSVKECKDAIDAYFKDRNRHFKINPKKAGKKIWGKERTLSKFDITNNCKDPRY